MDKSTRIHHFSKTMYDYLVIIRKATWSILLPELLAFDSLCSIVIHAICSYYMSKLGAILGRYSSTPLMASVFSDRRVLQGFFYPREVRLYTQLLLCLSIGTLFWSLAVIVKALEHEYFYTRSEKYDTISPKLPFSTPFRSSTPSRYTPFIASSSATDQSSPIRRTIYISRIKKFSVLFCFCIAFFKNQKITSTLIYHPVSSPILSSLETTPEEQSENGEVLSDNMHTSSMHHLKEIVSPVRHNDAIVPSIVHFVFGMEESFGDKPFGFAHYLSMYSAIIETKTGKIMFWYNFLPSSPGKPNWWFDRILSDAERANVSVELKKAREFDNIFGRPITNFAHKADIIRLEALLEYGGIYLDLDVYTIRSFEPLRHFDTVLGLEGGVPSLKPQGLCNGIIVSIPNSPFLRRWYESYRSFDYTNWAGHSVQKPLELALQYPNELLVLDPYALFYPVWNDQGLRLVHSRMAEVLAEGWDFEDSHQFAYHAWSKLAHKRWLSKLTPEKIFTIETSFNILMRRWTSHALRQDWKTAKRNGLVT